MLRCRPQVTSRRPGPVRRQEVSRFSDGRQDSSLTQNEDAPSRPAKPVRTTVIRRPQLVRHPDSLEEEEAVAQFGSQDTFTDEVNNVN